MGAEIFVSEAIGDTLVITPNTNLRELDFDAIQAGARAVLEVLESGQVKHVVLDFANTDYYGSTALSFFVKLWKRVKCGGGRMVFCGVSPHEREILEVTHLDSLWPVCPTREKALAEVHKAVAKTP